MDSYELDVLDEMSRICAKTVADPDTSGRVSMGATFLSYAVDNLMDIRLGELLPESVADHDREPLQEVTTGPERDWLWLNGPETAYRRPCRMCPL